LATTANPQTGEQDADTLGALNDGWNHQNFGLYARIIESGKISIEDTLELL
jgi:MOSC domain-containing protein YiiM